MDNQLKRKASEALEGTVKKPSFDAAIWLNRIRATDQSLASEIAQLNPNTLTTFDDLLNECQNNLLFDLQTKLVNLWKVQEDLAAQHRKQEFERQEQEFERQKREAALQEQRQKEEFERQKREAALQEQSQKEEFERQKREAALQEQSQKEEFERQWREKFASDAKQAGLPDDVIEEYLKEFRGVEFNTVVKTNVFYLESSPSLSDKAKNYLSNLNELNSGASPSKLYQGIKQTEDSSVVTFAAEPNHIFPLETLFVRQVYIEIYERILKVPDQVYIIIGDPGTGKSSFMRYVYAKLVQNKKKVFLTLENGSWMTHDGRNNFDGQDSESEVERWADKDTYLLIDGTVRDVFLRKMKRVIVFSSPQRNNYQKMKKENDGYELFD
jgi:flagellar biosynthesis GTPase FlhF